VNLIPVFVAILSFFVLNETMDIQKITGIFVVIAGLFLAQSGRRQPPKQKIIEVQNI
jgi:drug/metabolite transporter (DMT)-like permease